MVEGSPQHTGFPNPITGLIVNFHQKIGTFQQNGKFSVKIVLFYPKHSLPESYLDE